MKVLLLLLALTMNASLFAQTDTWKVIHNGQIKLEAKEESDQNILYIKPVDFNKKGLLHLIFKPLENDKDWQREIMVNDPEENELVKLKGGMLKLQNTELKKFFKRSKTLHIYTISLPKDPKLAATVRVRRVHLCTLVLK